MYAEICAPVHLDKNGLTYRSRRYSSRTVRRSFRRRRVAGSRYRRRYRRGRRSRKTTSAYVTLTQNSQWTLSSDNGSTRKWNVFTFSPATVPGFMDYRATYSHFRIVKCKLYMSRTFVGNIGTSGVTCNYLTVGSRPSRQSRLPGTRTPALMPWSRRSWRVISARPSGRRYAIHPRPPWSCQSASIPIP